MAFGRFKSVQEAGTLVGSYLEANYPQEDVDVEMCYSGTAGSVFLLINR